MLLKSKYNRKFYFEKFSEYFITNELQYDDKLYYSWFSTYESYNYFYIAVYYCDSAVIF